MRRIFIKALLQERLVITGSDAHHLGHVMRSKVGDKLIVADDAGAVGEYEICGFTAETVELKLVELMEENTESPIEITLAQCLPKGDKLEFIVQKATELGVNRIVPLVSHNCVVKYDAKKAAAKVAKWQRIADEAGKQCGRTLLPEVESIISFKDYMQKLAKLGLCTSSSLSNSSVNSSFNSSRNSFSNLSSNSLNDTSCNLLSDTSSDVFKGESSSALNIVSNSVVGSALKIADAQSGKNFQYDGDMAVCMCYENEEHTSIKNFLQNAGLADLKKYIIIVGPEGGFTLEENALAKEMGIPSVSLGNRILRAETAAISAVTIIQYENGDLGGRMSKE